jgi:hypothetical protein
VVDSSIAEVMGALSVMRFCQDVGFFYVLFEGMPPQFVKETNSAPPFLSKIGHFIESIHAELLHFRVAKFSFYS